MNSQPKAGKLLEELLNLHIYLGETDLEDKIIKYLDYKKLISEPRNVLDHGFVRLVDYMGNDLSIVRAARVSYDGDWRTGNDEGKDTKLIGYLLRNKHTSPFESVIFTFEIKCPIFVLRQWGRHRTQDYNDGAGIGYEKFWSYNEVSARYTELPEEFYTPQVAHITTQSKNSKQARTETQHENADLMQDLMRESCNAQFSCYKNLLNSGCPRELARIIFPVNTYTRLFATVNLHNLLLWLERRIHSHAQYEIRVYAMAIEDIICNIVPVTMEAWNEIRKNSNG
jgi:thymidylate synthase (FAD)